MNKLILMLVCIILFQSCANEPHSHGGHASHGPHPLQSLAHSDSLELVVDYPPIIVGKSTRFTSHFSLKRNSFVPLTEGVVRLRLEGKGATSKFRADAPKSAGIYSLALKPMKAGTYDLVFEVSHANFKQELRVKDVVVYADKEAAKAGVSHKHQELAAFTKEQSWRVDFTTQEVTVGPFAEIMKVTGEINAAQGDEVVLTAKSSGIVSFNGSLQIGSAVSSNDVVMTVSGSGLTEGNLDTKYQEAKSLFDKTKIDYDRAKLLVVDKIISEKSFQETELAFENAKIHLRGLTKDYTSGGQQVETLINGFIKRLDVHEGQYVAVGQPLMCIAQNKRLLLTADVPQKHFSKLATIRSANFKTGYNDLVYHTDSLNGKLISYGKTAGDHAYHVPVNFEIDNEGDLIQGAFIEVYLKANIQGNMKSIPRSSLMEEQGHYFVYVQQTGEGFERREVVLGPTDGRDVAVLDGLNAGERIVSQGAFQIKLANMAGKLPAHGHSH